jgi:hypothetical protein
MDAEEGPGREPRLTTRRRHRRPRHDQQRLGSVPSDMFAGEYSSLVMRFDLPILGSQAVVGLLQLNCSTYSKFQIFFLIWYWTAAATL